MTVHNTTAAEAAKKSMASRPRDEELWLRHAEQRVLDAASRNRFRVEIVASDLSDDEWRRLECHAWNLGYDTDLGCHPDHPSYTLILKWGHGRDDPRGRSMRTSSSAPRVPLSRKLDEWLPPSPGLLAAGIFAAGVVAASVALVAGCVLL